VWAAFMSESGGKGGILIEKPPPGCGRVFNVEPGSHETGKKSTTYC